MIKKLLFLMVWRGIIVKWIEIIDMICLFVELLAEMVLMVDVSDGLDDIIIKIIVFMDCSTRSW